MLTHWLLVPTAGAGGLPQQSDCMLNHKKKKRKKKNTKSHGWRRRRRQRSGPWWAPGKCPRARWDKRGIETSRHGVGPPSFSTVLAASKNRALSRGMAHGCRRSSWKVFAPGRTGRAADSSLRAVACPVRTSLNTLTTPMFATARTGRRCTWTFLGASGVACGGSRTSGEPLSASLCPRT